MSANARTADRAALLLDRVTCTFAARGRGRDSKGEEGDGRYTAVRDTTLAVAPGEFVSVVGPTGCGKSTLLNVAAGLLQPSSGNVRVLGKSLVGINRQSGYMFQAESLMPWRNALDNVLAVLNSTRRTVTPIALAWTASSGATRTNSRGECASAWRWHRC